VFDCDGLLLETESCWTLAEEELFAVHGKVFGDEEKRTLLGTSLFHGSRILARLLEQPDRADELGRDPLHEAAVNAASEGPRRGADRSTRRGP